MVISILSPHLNTPKITSEVLVRHELSLNRFSITQTLNRHYLTLNSCFNRECNTKTNNKGAIYLEKCKKRSGSSSQERKGVMENELAILEVQTEILQETKLNHL